MPRQIPRSGRPDWTNARMRSAHPSASRRSIAGPNAPSPGTTTAAAASSDAGSAVTRASTPWRSSAWRMLCRFPAP